jgi:hypothetical protein
MEIYLDPYENDREVKIIQEHDKSKLVELLEKIRYNLDHSITIDGILLIDRVGSLQDLIEASGIDYEGNYILLSNIIETREEYLFSIVTYDSSYGSFACYDLGNTPHRYHHVIIQKKLGV